MTYIRDPEAAENNAAAQMHAIGFPDARTTGPGADHGIDVIAKDAIAQVKWRGAQVPRSDIQRLVGARDPRTHSTLLFFSASGYSTAAIEYADQLGVLLFVYDPDGSIHPVGQAASLHLATLTRKRAEPASGTDEKPPRRTPAPSAQLSQHSKLGLTPEQNAAQLQRLRKGVLTPEQNAAQLQRIREAAHTRALTPEQNADQLQRIRGLLKDEKNKRRPDGAGGRGIWARLFRRR